ncbi:MAG: magnesium/cobalt transporter CorA [Dehalococcoidia bacterium]|nr:magnesium/cobalt transporter CorA [Dehalococcoidia bacterium]
MDIFLLYFKEGQPAQETDPQEIRARLGETSGPYWLSITLPKEEDLAWLGQTWGFHPLTLDDCRTYNPRPKLEEYPSYLFLILHEVSRDKEEFKAIDIQFYFSQEYLITIQREESKVLGRKQERAADLSRGTDFLLYRFMNQLSEDYFVFLGIIDERIERVEEQVIARPAQRLLHRIFLLKQNLIFLLRLVAPFREILHQINSHEYPYIGSAHQLYFRDIYNSLVFVQEMIETQRDLTSGALAAYMSALSNNLNEVMKRLTLIATIFMPISFIAALGGMNFEFLPFHEPLAMWFVLVVIMLLPLAMLGWFRARNWL